MAQIACQPRFQRAVQILRAADEPDRGHAEPMAVHRAFRGGDQAGVVGQPKIVVGAQVQHPPAVHLHMRRLGAGDQPLAFHQAIGRDVPQGALDMVKKGSAVGHAGPWADVGRE